MASKKKAKKKSVRKKAAKKKTARGKLAPSKNKRGLKSAEISIGLAHHKIPEEVFVTAYFGLHAHESGWRIFNEMGGQVHLIPGTRKCAAARFGEITHQILQLGLANIGLATGPLHNFVEVL